VEEILQDINEFPSGMLFVLIFLTTMYFIVSYIGIRRTITWRQHGKGVAVFFIILWLFIVLVVRHGEHFVSKENFDSLTKMEGTLQYNDDDGFYLPLTKTIPEKHCKLNFNLLDDEKNLLQFKDEFVGIWKDSEFAYQFEHNGKVIYSLEQSNAKVLGTKKNFKSLHKIEGILQYNDNEGFYMIEPPQVEEKHFHIYVHLLDTFDNISDKYKNQFVTIWQKDHVAYQLEHDGKVIYSLERSNSKVWIAVIYDFIGYYLFTFSFCLAHFIQIMSKEIKK
jgi:hypothetical protein